MMENVLEKSESVSYTHLDVYKRQESKILPRLFQRILDQELEQVLPFIIQNVSSCLESADIFHQQFKGQPVSYTHLQIN